LLPNGWRLTPLRNSSPPKKRVVIAPGGGAAWPRPIGRYYLNNKSKTAIKGSLNEPWPKPTPRAMSIGDFPMRRIRERGPLGRFRYLVTILAGILQSQFGVLFLSLGQSLPPER